MLRQVSLVVLLLFAAGLLVAADGPAAESKVLVAAGKATIITQCNYDDKYYGFC